MTHYYEVTTDTERRVFSSAMDAVRYLRDLLYAGYRVRIEEVRITAEEYARRARDQEERDRGMISL